MISFHQEPQLLNTSCSVPFPLSLVFGTTDHVKGLLWVSMSSFVDKWRADSQHCAHTRLLIYLESNGSSLHSLSSQAVHSFTSKLINSRIFYSLYSTLGDQKNKQDSMSLKYATQERLQNIVWELMYNSVFSPHLRKEVLSESNLLINTWQHHRTAHLIKEGWPFGLA